MRTDRVRLVGAAVVLCVLAAGLVGVAGGQVQGRKAVPERHTQLWIPPGKYTAIVFATTARERRWVVSIKTDRGSYPVTIGTEETVVVPFEEGWTISPDDQARVESFLVPFADISEINLVDGDETIWLTAWGVTAQGPVNFVPPKKRRP